MRSLAVLCCAGALLASCGGKGAGATPEETVRNLDGALQAADLGSVYDMLSKQAVGQADQAYALLRRAKAALGDESLEGLATRDYLVRLGREHEDELRAYRVTLERVVTEGDEARAEIRLETSEDQGTASLPLVREGGRWKIGSFLALRPALPADG